MAGGGLSDEDPAIQVQKTANGFFDKGRRGKPSIEKIALEGRKRFEGICLEEESGDGIRKLDVLEDRPKATEPEIPVGGRASGPNAFGDFFAILEKEGEGDASGPSGPLEHGVADLLEEGIEGEDETSSVPHRVVDEVDGSVGSLGRDGPEKDPGIVSPGEVPQVRAICPEANLDGFRAEFGEVAAVADAHALQHRQQSRVRCQQVERKAGHEGLLLIPGDHTWFAFSFASGSLRDDRCRGDAGPNSFTQLRQQASSYLLAGHPPNIRPDDPALLFDRYPRHMLEKQGNPISD